MSWIRRVPTQRCTPSRNARLDGFDPVSGVIVDATGNLYGTTLSGGALNCTGGQHNAVGCGTVFKLSAAHVESVFSLQGGDYPNVRLVQDRAGNLYGSAEWSGPTAGTPAVLFKMTPSGAETVLFTTFTGGGLDRSYPTGSLALDASGNLYGTTQYGGAPSAPVRRSSSTQPERQLSLSRLRLPAPAVEQSQATFRASLAQAVCAAYYEPGTVVTLTATAATGSAFTTWDVAGCSGTGTCTVTHRVQPRPSSSQRLSWTSRFQLPRSRRLSVSPGGSAHGRRWSVTAANRFTGSVSFTCAVTPTPALAPDLFDQPQFRRSRHAGHVDREHYRNRPLPRCLPAPVLDCFIALLSASVLD